MKGHKCFYWDVIVFSNGILYIALPKFKKQGEKKKLRILM